MVASPLWRCSPQKLLLPAFTFEMLREAEVDDVFGHSGSKPHHLEDRQTANRFKFTDPDFFCVINAASKRLQGARSS